MQRRRVVVVVFPEVQSLDVTGPVEVFHRAGRVAASRGIRASYDIELVAPEPGAVRTSSGIPMHVERRLADVRAPVDTLLVAGGDGVTALVRDAASLGVLRRLSTGARRTASVCTGAFALAEAGLFDGRRATTHWLACAALAARYPSVRVEPDPIFVRDGDVWSSAGVTAGMDLALALVEEDLGRDVALETARHLVLFLTRPGGQSQFSAQSRSQLAERPPLRELQAWICDHPHEVLSVERLADRVAMSPRNFARAFRREVGTTPARFVEAVRVEAARRLLEESSLPVEEVAARCGFGTAETMRRSFHRGLRVHPSEYRRRFRAGDPNRVEELQP